MRANKLTAQILKARLGNTERIERLERLMTATEGRITMLEKRLEDVSNGTGLLGMFLSQPWWRRMFSRL